MKLHITIHLCRHYLKYQMRNGTTFSQISDVQNKKKCNATCNWAAAPNSVFKQAANSVVGSYTTLNPKQQVQPNYSCLACSCMWWCNCRRMEDFKLHVEHHDALDLTLCLAKLYSSGP